MGWLGVSVLVRWLLGWLLSWQLPLLPRGQRQDGPRVSVLIPARNEESTLPRLLAYLGQQNFQADEVIVNDDHSSDRTADVALERAGDLPITVIQPPPWPPVDAANPGPCTMAWPPAALRCWCFWMPIPNRALSFSNVY